MWYLQNLVRTQENKPIVCKYNYLYCLVIGLFNAARRYLMHFIAKLTQFPFIKKNVVMM